MDAVAEFGDGVGLICALWINDRVRSVLRLALQKMVVADIHLGLIRKRGPSNGAAFGVEGVYMLQLVQDDFGGRTMTILAAGNGDVDAFRWLAGIGLDQDLAADGGKQVALAPAGLLLGQIAMRFASSPDHRSSRRSTGHHRRSATSIRFRSSPERRRGDSFQ